MLVTGYGSYNGKDYWLVKNRWAVIIGNLKLHINVAYFIQLEQELGRQWLHIDGQKQVQPMWDCFGCSFPNVVVLNSNRIQCY